MSSAKIKVMLILPYYNISECGNEKSIFYTGHTSILVYGRTSIFILNTSTNIFENLKSENEKDFSLLEIK